MNDELTFFLRVLRNGAILAGLYFFSVYAANSELTYAVCKPVVVFLGTYVFTELGARYGLAKGSIPSLNKRGATTLLF